MDRINIDTWANISAESWNSLLLGNGASIAIHKEFAYPTLHSVADAKGLLVLPEAEWQGARHDDEEPEEDTYDRFIRNGQYPVR